MQMLPSFKGLINAVERFKLDPVHTVVEIGAMDCKESLDLASVFPLADIYPFECNPNTIQACRDAVAGHPRIHLIEKAVCDYVGRAKFYPSDTKRNICPQPDGNHGISSLLRINEKIEWCGEKYFQTETEVPCTMLAQFMAEQYLDGIDVLWLDAQGAELSILEGATNRLRDIKLILTEVVFKEQYVGQPQYSEIRKFLEACGFFFYEWAAPPWMPYAGDAIFLNTKLL